MWQFAEAVRGLADGCRELGVPVTGGNVSFYNQTGASAVDPTPVVGVLGVLADVARRTTMGFREAGEVVYLLGTTRAELGGSEWAAGPLRSPEYCAIASGSAASGTTRSRQSLLSAPGEQGCTRLRTLLIYIRLPPSVTTRTTSRHPAPD